VLPEPESAALDAELDDGPRVVTSVIGLVETRRAAGAADADPEVLTILESVLEKATVIEVTRAIGELAARVKPALLRSLDAVHLATALTLGKELDAFVVYDHRLAEAAHEAGLPVRTPGR
jgi:predicted nucleic acid-binding protein